MEERGRGPGAQPESVNTRIDYSIHNSIHQSPVNNGNDSNQITTKRLFEIRIFRMDVLVVEWASWNLIRSSGKATTNLGGFLMPLCWLTSTNSISQNIIDERISQSMNAL